MLFEDLSAGPVYMQFKKQAFSRGDVGVEGLETSVFLSAATGTLATNMFRTGEDHLIYTHATFSSDGREADKAREEPLTELREETPAGLQAA